MSPLSLAIVPFYLAVALAALVAARSATRSSEATGARRRWILIAGFFTLLILLRLIDAEDIWRESVRGWLRERDLYEGRARLQAPLSAIAIFGGSALLAIVWRGWRSSAGKPAQRCLHLAITAVLGFVPLYGLRLVSLHATDVLLYSGPIRLNWFLDGGLTLLAGLAAVWYSKLLRRQPGRR